MTHPKKMYIGTKRLMAVLMTKREYLDLRCWPTPIDEDPSEVGYLVEYMDGGKPNLEGYAGYVSWSPIDVFQAAYRPCDQATFGMALEAIKKGLRARREGWNGKGMWIALSPGTPGLPAERFWNPNNKAFALSRPGQTADVLPCITFKTADDQILMGWFASQTDMLAEDWVILPPIE